MAGFTTRPEIDGTFGVVASTHWIGTAVGMAMLERGGNAFDAAIATAFTLQVVEPHLCGPGGDVPVIVHDVRRGRTEVICGQGPAPAGATIAHYRAEGLDIIPGTGLLAACVPGTFETWMLLLRDYGTMSLRDVLTLSIGYAEHGHPLVPQAAAGIASVAGWVPVAWRAQVTPEDRVLVLGGTGAVGRVAAQAARLLGAAQVVAVGRDGLDRIGDELGDAGFTVCIDPVWGEPLAHALRHAAPHARIVHVGQSAGPEAPLRSADVRSKELTIIGHSNFALTKEDRDRAYLELLDHVAAGRIAIEVERYPLDRVAEAWERQRSGPGAKVVVELR